MSNDIAAATGIATCILVAVLAYLLHDTLGLTAGTALRMAFFMAVLAIGAIALWFFSAQSYDGSLFGPGNLWPFLLALFVVCWFPALDEWSASWGTSTPSFLGYSDDEFFQARQWWGTRWAKFLWFSLPLAGGYGWKYWRATR